MECVSVCERERGRETGKDNMAPIQRADVNDDLLKWPVTMETFYKSIRAIHTEEH